MDILNIIPDVGIKPRAALMQEGAELKTALAASKLRLFTDALGGLGVNTTLADLVAAEADFSGYTAGGNTIAAFGDPYADTNRPGVLIVAPTSQFNFTDPDPDPAVTNNIKGFFLVDSTGKLRGAVEFDQVVPMSTNDCSLPIVVAFRLKS